MFYKLFVKCFFWWLSFLQGIISDLFPGVFLPKPDYDLLLKAINHNIAKFNLQPDSWFIGKIIQVIIEG